MNITSLIDQCILKVENSRGNWRDLTREAVLGWVRAGCVVAVVLGFVVVVVFFLGTRLLNGSFGLWVESLVWYGQWDLG